MREGILCWNCGVSVERHWSVQGRPEAEHGAFDGDVEGDESLVEHPKWPSGSFEGGMIGGVGSMDGFR